MLKIYIFRCLMAFTFTTWNSGVCYDFYLPPDLESCGPCRPCVYEYLDGGSALAIRQSAFVIAGNLQETKRFAQYLDNKPAWETYGRALLFSNKGLQKDDLVRLEKLFLRFEVKNIREYLVKTYQQMGESQKAYELLSPLPFLQPSINERLALSRRKAVSEKLDAHLEQLVTQAMQTHSFDERSSGLESHFKPEHSYRLVTDQGKIYRYVLMTLQNVSSGVLHANGATYRIKDFHRAEEICDIFTDTLCPLVDGDQFEHIVYFSRADVAPLSCDEWEEEWEKRDTSCLLNEDGEVYHREIYPIAMEYLRRLKVSSIFEICGGRGDFFELFLSKNAAAVERYQMVELGEKNCAKAREKLKSIQNTFSKLKGEVVCCDITATDLTKVAGSPVIVSSA
ncbi:MAG: hypothetical protein ACHQT8_03095 [Chlamydiales bacterium]